MVKPETRMEIRAMAMNMKRRLGIRIAAARRRRGLTQEQLAERVGRTVEAISNIERGRSLPGLGTVELLSRHLDIPLREFFDDDPDRSVSPRRYEREARARELLRSLSDRDLEIALGQLEVLSGARRR